MIKVIALMFSSLLSVILFHNYLVMPAEAGSSDFYAGNVVVNKTLEEWAKEYWQWWITLPETIPKDPDNNLDKCFTDSDQTGVMTFLVDPYQITYNTKCTIPSNSYILVPLLVGECDPTVPDPRAKSNKIEDKWACARDADEIFKSWEVVLDGRTLFKSSGNNVVNQDLKDEILVRNSSIFTINIPEMNRYDAPPGSYPAVVDGYYLILKPLPVGEHALKYSIVHEIPVPGVGMPQQIPGKVAYDLTVK
jgi:hypothetical protein